MGFTLIEATFAVMIVGLVFTATISMTTSAFLYNDLEQERSRAHQIVSEKLEEIQRDLYTYISPGRQVTVWNNGTPENPDDDTIGCMIVQARDGGGNLVVAAPVPAVGLTVEVTLAWNPRGRLGGAGGNANPCVALRDGKVMRESVMTYIAP